MNFGIKTSFIYLYHAYINIINRTRLSYNLFIIHLHEQPFMRTSHRVNIFNLNMNPVILGFDFGQALKEFLCVRLEDLCRSSKWCWIIFQWTTKMSRVFRKAITWHCVKLNFFRLLLIKKDKMLFWISTNWKNVVYWFTINLLFMSAT